MENLLALTCESIFLSSLFVIVANPIQSSASFKVSNAASVAGRRGHGRVTLADVAAHAGVTTMTVSRYLRSPERVAPVTALSIAQALHKTGYSPNLQAGSLASGRSQAVAVIVPNLTHSIFADTLHGLGAGLQAEGLQMLVSSTGYSLALEEQQVRTVLGWAPAAVVITGRRHNALTQQLLQAAQARGTPIVEIWDQSPQGEDHDFQQIGFDHVQVGNVMAKALIERGYKRLCFIDSGVEEDFRAHERAEGFLDTAHALGVQAELMQAAVGDAIEMGNECFTRWHGRPSLQAAPSVAAVLSCGFGFANDLLATGALLAAYKAGYSVPCQIGMIGFGDFPVGRYCLGGLSTMHIDGERMGQACANFIVARLKTPHAHGLCRTEQARQVVLQPQLLWRGL
jgi:LacI family transcriptional regulator, gluconate utilization system Gnt-I transcriptional repressor